MLKYILQNSDFGAIAKLGPSNFFRAVRISEVVAVAMKIHANGKDGPKWAQARAEVAAIVRPFDVELSESVTSLDKVSYEVGQTILRVFFAQLLGSSMWILDFRPNVWSFARERGLSWSPSALFLEPRSDFVHGIRSLYLGYYENEEQLFSEGIKTLGLLPAEDVLRDHFGIGDQSAVRFDLKSLEKTFALVFEVCAVKRSTIHPEFAAFGLCLLTLYQTLQLSGAEFDVRAAFMAAKQELP